MVLAELLLLRVLGLVESVGIKQQQTVFEEFDGLALHTLLGSINLSQTLG